MLRSYCVAKWHLILISIKLIYIYSQGRQLFIKFIVTPTKFRICTKHQVPSLNHMKYSSVFCFGKFNNYLKKETKNVLTCLDHLNTVLHQQYHFLYVGTFINWHISRCWIGIAFACVQRKKSWQRYDAFEAWTPPSLLNFHK